MHSGYAGSILPGLLITGTGFGLILIGAAIGTALLNTFAVSATSGYLASHPKVPDAAAQASVHGNTVAFWVTVAVFALGALTCGLLVRPGRQPESTESESALTAAI
ncbi:hypothetical protein [Streptomyces sp. SID2888]|uniref:hypothetical protein n=1 Tax=Streptomyces sp. SID2888 TaxID=2690256 RepID=UPI00136FFC5C|nr:hypothetical protein [Streptomyces sp. SID2888]MYV46034.1 hypothetical protein [Streptomyces sp. SID2888]